MSQQGRRNPGPIPTTKEDPVAEKRRLDSCASSKRSYKKKKAETEEKKKEEPKTIEKLLPLLERVLHKLEQKNDETAHKLEQENNKAPPHHRHQPIPININHTKLNNLPDEQRQAILNLLLRYQKSTDEKMDTVKIIAQIVERNFLFNIQEIVTVLQEFEVIQPITHSHRNHNVQQREQQQQQQQQQQQEQEQRLQQNQHQQQLQQQQQRLKQEQQQQQQLQQQQQRLQQQQQQPPQQQQQRLQQRVQQQQPPQQQQQRLQQQQQQQRINDSTLTENNANFTANQKDLLQKGQRIQVLGGRYKKQLGNVVKTTLKKCHVKLDGMETPVQLFRVNVLPASNEVECLLQENKRLQSEVAEQQKEIERLRNELAESKKRKEEQQMLQASNTDSSRSETEKAWI